MLARSSQRSALGAILVAVSLVALAERDRRSAPPSIETHQERAASPAGARRTDGLRVDLNSASEAELQRLPRVGPALARRIVEFRASNGPFDSVEALADVRGVGPATLQAVRPFVEAREITAQRP